MLVKTVGSDGSVRFLEGKDCRFRPATATEPATIVVDGASYVIDGRAFLLNAEGDTIDRFSTGRKEG
jgi:hypothetical protein